MTPERKPRWPKKKPGRPKSPKGPRPLLETRASPGLVATVVRMAKEESRSKAGMVHRLIEEAVAAREAKSED